MRTAGAALCADDQFLRSAASMLRAYLPDLMDAMRLSNLYRLLFMEDRLLVTAASITVDRESQSCFFFYSEQSSAFFAGTKLIVRYSFFELFKRSHYILLLCFRLLFSVECYVFPYSVWLH